MESRKPDLKYIELWKEADKKNSNAPFWDTIKPEQSINKSADQALKNAKEAAFVSLPVITALGVTLMCDNSSKGGGFINLDFRPLGLPIAIGGLVLDAIKAPLCLAVATEEGLRGSLTKLASLLFEKNPTKEAADLIFNSFLLRLKQTGGLLIQLGLEKPETLAEKFESGNIEDLIGLTLLYTAYVSRHCDKGLYLASEKQLVRENCPPDGLLVFDAIMNLKKSINEGLEAGLCGKKYHSKDEQNLEEASIAHLWIADIKKGEILTLENKPGSTEKQLKIVNKIIEQINKLKVYAIAILPESQQNVAIKAFK